MILTIINIFFISFIITVIWDVSPFITDLTKIIYEKLNNKPWLGQQLPKPISCSFCMNFWVTFIYLLFNISILYSLTIACFFTFIQTVMKKLLIKLQNKIDQL